MITGTSDLLGQLGIDNPWSMGKTWLVKRRFHKRVCFLIVYRNVVTVIVMDKFSQSIQNPFIAANLLRVLRVRDVCAHVLTKVSAFQISFLHISLNKSQTPWDQDALPSYYVLGCRRVCEHIQEFSASLRVSTCFGFVIERAGKNVLIVFFGRIRSVGHEEKT